MTAKQEKAIIDLLWSSMKRDREHSDRVQTGWGTKSKAGLVVCIERIMREDNLDRAIAAAGNQVGVA